MRRFILFFLIICGLVSVPVAAQALEYAIGDYHVEVTVLPDGDYQVEERIEYRVLSGDMSEGMRTIPRTRLDDISDLTVTAEEADLSTFEIDRQGGNLRLRWSFPERRNDLTVTLRYRAEGALQGVDGRNRVDWMALGEGWSVPVSDLQARLRVPKAWADGPQALRINPRTVVRETEQYWVMDWAFGRVPAGEGRRIRISFPEAVASARSPSSDGRNLWAIGGILSVPILVLVGIGVAAFVQHQKVKRAVRSTPPDDIDLASAIALLSEGGGFKGGAHPALLLDMASQGYLKLIPGEKKWFGQSKVRVVAGERSLDELPDPERALAALVVNETLDHKFQRKTRKWRRKHGETIRDRLFQAGWITPDRERRHQALAVLAGALAVVVFVGAGLLFFRPEGTPLVVGAVVCGLAGLTGLVSGIVALQLYRLTEAGRAQRLALKGWLYHIRQSFNARRYGTRQGLALVSEHLGWVGLADAGGQRLAGLKRALKRESGPGGIADITPPAGIEVSLSEKDRQRYGETVAVALAVVTALRETQAATAVATGGAAGAGGAGGGGGGGGGAAGGGGGGAG